MIQFFPEFPCISTKTTSSIEHKRRGPASGFATSPREILRGDKCGIFTFRAAGGFINSFLKTAGEGDSAYAKGCVFTTRTVRTTTSAWSVMAHKLKENLTGKEVPWGKIKTHSSASFRPFAEELLLSLGNDGVSG